MRRSECALDGAHGTAKSKPAGIKLGMLTSYGRTCEKQEFSSLSSKVGLQADFLKNDTLCDPGKRHPSTCAWLKTRERGEHDHDIRYG